MGQHLGAHDAKNVVNSLNWAFDEDIANTYQKVIDLRLIYPTFLNPAVQPQPFQRRRQTCRFAGLLLSDLVPFDQSYPARKFKKWLKWLTWLQLQTSGTIQLNGTAYTGTAGELVVNTLARALPQPLSVPIPISFSWFETSAFSCTVNTPTSAKWTVDVLSIKSDDVHNVNSDDEDDGV
jgi:hypothetical protein